MKTNKKSLANHRDIIKRKNALKNEIKLIIIKSLLQNKTNTPKLRSFLRIKLNSFWKKTWSKSNQRNICVISGKKKTTFKISSLSRQLTKRFIEHGLLQNIKIK